MTSSACNQIHMPPSLFSLSLVYLSISRWNSFFFYPSDFVSTFLSLFVYPLSHSLVFLSLLRSLSPSLSTTSVFFPLCLLFLISAQAPAWASLLKWTVILISRFAGLLWPQPVFYGHSLAEDLLFTVVITCCTVQIVVIAC